MYLGGFYPIPPRFPALGPQACTGRPLPKAGPGAEEGKTGERFAAGKRRHRPDAVIANQSAGWPMRTPFRGTRYRASLSKPTHLVVADAALLAAKSKGLALSLTLSLLLSSKSHASLPTFRGAFALRAKEERRAMIYYYPTLRPFNVASPLREKRGGIPESVQVCPAPFLGSFA